MNTIAKCLLDGKLFWMIDCNLSENKFESFETIKLKDEEKNDEADGR